MTGDLFTGRPGHFPKALGTFLEVTAQSGGTATMALRTAEEINVFLSPDDRRSTQLK